MTRAGRGRDPAAQGAADAERVAQYCPDLATWPRSWSVEPRDIAPGQQLVERFTPFLLHLLAAGLSRKTLRLHRDNLWALGGEMIRTFYDDPPSRHRGVEAWLAKAIGEDGGPLLSHRTSEPHQRAFDSTCRRFYRFLRTASPQTH